ALARFLGWPQGGVVIHQGEEVGSPSRIELAWTGPEVTIGGEVLDRGLGGVDLDRVALPLPGSLPPACTLRVPFPPPRPGFVPVAEASAPASAANLGPGFDILAMALELRCRVSAEPAATWSIDHGEGHQPDIDSDDADPAAAKAAVGEGTPLALKVDNEIPIGRGMGSAAAALAAEASAALAAIGDVVDDDHVFRLVVDLEGHHDNAAAAVYGGLILVPAVGQPLRL